ncbi:RHOMBOID-like protein 2 [Vicia villosa]|uniref:RHOMBOID-like protein 2 n=1 Tax=Vicia villosa TaxID=3911 RepID=UPI00273B65E7|nr:RHOMBOID-like protein 2 [Vicia villosa]
MNSKRDVESGGEGTKSTNNYTAVANSISYGYHAYNHRISWLVPVVVAVNVVVFIVAMAINNCPEDNFGFQGDCVPEFLGRFSFQPWRENPLLGPSSSTLTKMGALKWENIVHQNQGWRLFTCILLHAGIIHLLSNMVYLVFISIRLQFGSLRIGLIYLLSGFGGSVLSSLFIRNSISVGASGALLGLLGAMLSELLTNWSIYFDKVTVLIDLLIIIIINLAIGILPYVDNFAHIGGFATGLLLGFVLLPRPQCGWLEQRSLPAGIRLKSKFKAYQYILGIVSLILLIVGFSIGLVMLFNEENGYDHCHWCHYLTCVPSVWECNNEN